jgi:membrane protease YdiL (CAAX protease family)
MEPMRRRDALFLALGFEGGLLLLSLLLGWLFSQPPLAQTHWNWRHFGFGLAATLPLLVGLWICVHRPFGPLRRIKAISEDFIRPVFQHCTVFDLAVISLVAGFGEEMLFRGVVQGLGDRWIGAGYGLAVASILFGLVHLITPTYALLATLCGVYFGVLVMLTDNLLAVLVPHGLYDFVALIYIVRWSKPAMLAESSSVP